MENKRSFLTIERPYVASIIKESSPGAAIASILNSERQGARGFMVDMTFMHGDDLSSENMCLIFGCSGRPMMPLFYRTGHMVNSVVSEEARANAILTSLDYGATAADVIGDLFEPGAQRELAMHPEAVRQQKELIGQIHNKGKEVLISSHTMDVLSAEEVLEHLMNQAERGADIAKIVTGCNTEDDLVESIRTTILLKREMPIPFIHLCNGRMGRLQRWFAPVLGSMLTFGIDRYTSRSLGAQPTVESARAVLHEMMWHMECN